VRQTCRKEHQSGAQAHLVTHIPPPATTAGKAKCEDLGHAHSLAKTPSCEAPLPSTPSNSKGLLARSLCVKHGPATSMALPRAGQFERSGVNVSPSPPDYEL